MADGLGSVVPFFQSISRICKKREPAKNGSLRSLPRRRKRAASNFASADALLLFRQAGTVCAASSSAESKCVLSCSRQWRIVEMVGEWRITRRAEGRRRFSGGCGAAFASLPALRPAAGPYCPAPLSRQPPTFQPFFSDMQSDCCCTLCAHTDMQPHSSSASEPEAHPFPPPGQRPGGFPLFPVCEEVVEDVLHGVVRVEFRLVSHDFRQHRPVDFQ